MFVFEGKPNKKAKKLTAELYKKKRILFGIFLIVLNIIVFTPIYLVFSYYFLLFFVFVTPISLLFLLLIIVTPTKIVFDDNTIIIVSDKNGALSQPVELDLDEIIEIKDVGDFYVCCVEKKFTKPIQGFVCQKDLLKQGTLEEFEERFKDKIVVVEQEPKK